MKWFVFEASFKSELEFRVMLSRVIMTIDEDVVYSEHLATVQRFALPAQKKGSYEG